ncbi:MAG: GNAT family N-acetyltransferase [Chitinophagales bacterium]|nr:GNAT family N-acetyltransferase [Chitinophagales bacterium]
MSLIANFSPFPFLESERLLFRALILEDAPSVFELRNNEVANAFIGRTKNSTMEESIEYIHKIQNYIKDNDSIFWTIILKENNQFIGTICLWNLDYEKNTVEVGYEMLPQYEGNGYMSEAIQTINYYGFNTMNASTIFACPSKANSKSVKLLERNNFIFDPIATANLPEAENHLIAYRIDK